MRSIRRAMRIVLPAVFAIGLSGKSLLALKGPDRTASEVHDPRSRAFTLVELLVVIAIIGILIALLLPAVQAAREAARRMQCQNHLKQIALAVLNYESTYNVFPVCVSHYETVAGADGNGISWMVAVLPYLEQEALYRSLNLNGRVASGQGIINPENYEAIKTPIGTYYCPSDVAYGTVKTNVWEVPAGIAFATTNYSGVMGPHRIGGGASLFNGLPDCHNYSTLDTKECTGTFWRHNHLAPVKIASFTDGTSNTIIIGEVLPKYDDFKYWALSNGTITSTHAPLNHLDPDADPWNNWPNQGFRSRHSGGAHFAWGDGHVSFLSESISMDVYQGLSTRARGETVSEP